MSALRAGPRAQGVPAGGVGPAAAAPAVPRRAAGQAAADQRAAARHADRAPPGQRGAAERPVAVPVLSHACWWRTRARPVDYEKDLQRT